MISKINLQGIQIYWIEGKDQEIGQQGLLSLILCDASKFLLLAIHVLLIYKIKSNMV